MLQTIVHFNPLNMLRFLPFCVLLLLIFNSCAYHQGTLAGGNAVITDTNASVSGTAYGYGQTIHILGIGGNQKEALLQEAKRNLRANSRLQPGQAFGQTSVNFKTQFFLVGWKTQVIVAADVIDFRHPQQRDTNHSVDEMVGGFKIGDTVYYQTNEETVQGRILEMTPAYSRIQFIDKRGHLKIKKIRRTYISNSKIKVQYPKLRSETAPESALHDTESFVAPQPSEYTIKVKLNKKVYVGNVLKREGDLYHIQLLKKDGRKVLLIAHEKDIVRE